MQIFPLVASYLAERAAEGGRIQAELPSDHPFARYLHQVGAFEYTTHPWCGHRLFNVDFECKNKRFAKTGSGEHTKS